ncbi:2-iminobutanoate/2-iminopropanoate deaminase [Buchnera aphidicola (Cinara kochiana kochiana)]|uniref:2-iminobutanoate/2-iminopropanoate deaminase n=1 Tax=Buchnera aphidicola (Cinara kochiana kochiana) TaxID=2518976 RepID=A0A451D605_9GAMM|nr:Rid family detoxifying hydrolase [Buchnera aphidicola]VFP81144.1 2-iminobutanoate/2-iminopropanoate deaminase [Buchnera aphidicola (Cinara kochiana kochiana)]
MLKEKCTFKKPFGPYSPILKINNLFFISGQIPVDQNTGLIPKYLTEQTTLVLNNINTLLKENQLSVKNIIKTTIFTTKINKLKEINLFYQKFFDKHTTIYPTRSCIGISELPKKVFIEIEAIASI